MSLNFIVRGQVVPAESVANFAERAKPKVSKERDAAHNGFAVEGYPPGYAAQCEASARNGYAAWASLSDDDRAAKLKDGQRAPEQWDEAAWAKRTKPKRVMRPFSVPAAAKDCKDIAERSGWTHLRITELIRDAA